MSRLPQEALQHSDGFPVECDAANHQILTLGIADFAREIVRLGGIRQRLFIRSLTS